MKRAILYLLMLFIFLYGCTGFAIKEKIENNYYLIATDNIDDLSLCFYEPNDKDIYGDIVDATVFAVGFNEKYLIAKQHPRTFPNPPDKKVTNYYILPLKNEMNWKTKNGLIGPLTMEQFKEKRKKLNIPDSLSFTIIIKELE